MVKFDISFLVEIEISFNLISLKNNICLQCILKKRQKENFLFKNNIIFHSFTIFVELNCDY